MYPMTFTYLSFSLSFPSLSAINKTEGPNGPPEADRWLVHGESCLAGKWRGGWTSRSFGSLLVRKPSPAAPDNESGRVWGFLRKIY